MPRPAAQGATLYARLGTDALLSLNTAFYDRVYADALVLPSTGERLRGVFANTTKADAVARQHAFLVERLGGPPLYTNSRGARARPHHRSSRRDHTCAGARDSAQAHTS